MTDVNLREYFERLLDEREKAQVAIWSERDKAQALTFQAALREAERKSEEIDRRLEGLNELRKEVMEDRVRFVERNEFKLRSEAVENRLSRIEQWMWKGIAAGMVFAAVAGFVASIFGTFWTR
jgi:hypothetical protein